MNSRFTFGTAVAGLLFLIGAFSTAQSAVIVNFSGGNGSPIEMTLPSAVSFIVLQTAPVSPIFVLDGAGNLFDGTAVTGSGLTFSINGGANIPMTFINSGAQGGAISLDDVFFYNDLSLSGVSAGDVITINAGTFTTDANVAAAPPLGNSFTTFIVGGGGVDQVSTDGVAVPEPASGLLVLGAAVAFLGLRKRG